MTAYNLDNTILYLEEQATEDRIETFMGEPHIKVNPTPACTIHHVCNAHFSRYIKKRKDTPRVCVIYQTVIERENALADMGFDL